MELPGFPQLILIGLIGIILLWVIIYHIRIVQEYERVVVFRLGRSIGSRGPGLVLLIPFVHRPVRVDLRERFFDVPPQSAISQDNASLSIDFIVYMRVVDPVSSVVEVEDFTGAARGIAITTLRAIVGDMMLDAVLSQRDQINEGMRTKLDEVTNRWGVKINAVEIREILPPKDIQEAMTRQMSAERTRRAAVTEAEGQREATITVAEGNKQAAILNAEGSRQATILEAEGHRQEAILTAQGFADALQRIYAVAQQVDPKTMSLQYLDALKAIGASPATKFVLPMELTTLMRSFSDFTARATDGTDGAEAQPASGEQPVTIVPDDRDDG
jgi:regulator of protease activity HflC (stomatin/prohibitin superfamily)